MKDILIIIAVLLTNLATIHAQQLTGSLQGTVIDNQGNPVENANIELRANFDKSTYKTKSNPQGEFTFNPIATGSYSLKAIHVSYQSTDQKIEIQADQTIETSLILQTANELKEVVVTAGRKAESIDEVPSSITILSAKEVQQQMNINPSISAVLGNTIPGLGTSTNKATNTGQTLRGRQVLVLIDGIPQSTPLMNGARDIRTLDPAIIEKVEVIKGATSIYGNGSGGGIINFITKAAVTDKRIAGTTTIGARSNLAHAENTVGYRVSQLFEGSINKFSYVISGAYDYNGVQKDAKGNVNAQGDGLGESALYNTFVKLNYKPNDNSSFVASYNLFRSTQNSNYINQVGKYMETPSTGIEGDDPGEPAGTPYNHNVLLSYSHTNLPLKTVLDITGYYNQFISVNRYVAESTSWYGAGQTKIQSFKKGIRLNLNTPWYVHDNFKGEITYGLDLLNDRTNQVLTDGRVYIPDMDMVNLAPYTQLKFDLWQHLVLKGGLRYENANVHVKDFNTIASGPGTEGSIAVSGGKIPYKATMFNVGLRYTKFDYFNPFISFSQGFAINELGRILRRATQNTLEAIETDPIITNNYELGLSSQLGIFRFTGAYYISTSDFGANLVDQGGYLVAQREPERVWGYEFTLDAYLNHKWTIGGSYSYVEGKAEQQDGSEIYMNGLRIAPPKATAYLAYHPTAALNLNLNWVFTGNRDRFDPRSTGLYANSEGPVSSVNLLNLSASYKINHKFLLGAGIENLLNTAYYPVVSQYRAIDAEYVRGNGAIVNLNLSYSY